MSFNCPVICSNTSSIPEVVGDAAIFFDPASADSIGQSLITVLSDDPLRVSLVSKGRQRVKMFSWQNCTEQTLDVYRKVLA
jgi:glycosyltransferase involved in cell wall biosynthesis